MSFSFRKENTAKKRPKCLCSGQKKTNGETIRSSVDNSNKAINSPTENKQEIPAILKKKIAMISNSSEANSAQIFRVQSGGSHLKLFQYSGQTKKTETKKAETKDGVRCVRIHVDKTSSKTKIFLS